MMMEAMKVSNKKLESLERRFDVLDISISDSDEFNIEGHAAVFNQKTNIGNLFYEVIERGAFDNCDFSDVSLLVNHNMENLPLARSKNGAGTMTLSVDSKGLFLRAKLDTENNINSKSLYSSISRGDIDGMSFCFIVDSQEWEDMDSEMPTRRIKRIKKVYEVSAVTYPAYSGTSIDTRSLTDLDMAKSQYKNNISSIELLKMKAEAMSIM